MAQIVRAAAVQISTRIADAPANMDSCERLALEAVNDGARFIALPEFFNTGVAWEPKLAETIETEDGVAASFLQEFSARHGVVIGGSFLCRISAGGVRNRYLAFAWGELIGRHDKDLPTMWENAFYEGGDPGDSGFLGSHDEIRVGAAVCWEYMRTMTARRLKGKVDVIMGGSCWWSIPDILPGFVQTPWEHQNIQNAIGCIRDTARLVGAPVIHAAHCGPIDCAFMGLPPLTYRGYYEGNAAIVDSNGNVIAVRDGKDGEGFVCADLTLGAVPVHEDIPDSFWLRSRGILPTIGWNYQGFLGRLWYRKHVRGI